MFLLCLKDCPLTIYTDSPTSKSLFQVKTTAAWNSVLRSSNELGDIQQQPQNKPILERIIQPVPVMGTQLVYKSIIYTCTRFFDITHDMGDTFFCVTGSPRLTLTLTQKPRLRISEPASGSMMLHIYSRWTNHTLRMPSEGRCASRDEGDHVVPGYHDSTASSQ